MMRRILVPTDGSDLADRALGPASDIAASQGAEIFLVRVTAPPAWLFADGGIMHMGPDVYQQIMDDLDEQARLHLAGLAQQLEHHDPPVRTSTMLLQGSPYAALLDYEADVNPDLVVMATHGRTGVARFALGSVADMFVREGTAPVLLVRSFGKETTSVRHALVPLDGSELAEQALTVVEGLAGKPIDQVFLLRVVETREERADAWSYVSEIVIRLTRDKLKVDFDVRVGRPTELILGRARSVDLVVMATHGRGGFDRFRHGSVATRVLQESPGPVLLVRASDVVARSATEAA
jgi:nucleotide-binding universal stress UspA family protein